MTNNNAMHTSVLNGNIQNNDMIPTVSNVSEQKSGSSRKQRHSSFQKNQIVFYKKNGKKSKAIIRSVHFDDELVPYFTIELDGREKQTDSAYLEACSPSIPQEQQHYSDTFSLLQQRLDPSPYVVVGSKRRKLNARKKTVTFGYLQVRFIEKLSIEERLRMRKELGLKEMEEKNYRELDEEKRIEEEKKRMREMERNREVGCALIPSVMIVGVISSFYSRCIQCIGSTVIAGRTAMMGLLSHTQGWGRDRYQCAALAIGSAKATTNQFLRSQLAFLESLCRLMSTKAFRYKTSQIFHKIVSTVALWIVLAAIILSIYFICQQEISATIIAVAASFHCSRKTILGWLFRGVQCIAQVFFSAKKRTNQFLRCGRDRYQCAALAIGSAKATTNQFLRSQLAFLKSISILGDHQPRPEDCSPSSIRQEERQRNDTFVLLPRIEPSLHVVVRNSTKRRKLNPRQKRVTFGYLQIREIDDMLSSEEKQVMRKELQEMVQKNREEMREEEMKRNPPRGLFGMPTLKSWFPGYRMK